MNKKISEIIDIVSSSTGIPKNQLDEASKSEDFSRWDSLSQVTMIGKFEKKTKKKVKVSQFSKFDSIRSIYKLY